MASLVDKQIFALPQKILKNSRLDYNSDKEIGQGMKLISNETLPTNTRVISTF